MSGSEQERQQHIKKKLQSFLTDMFKSGSVKGFQYFAMYLRGREELVISIVNTPVSPDNSYGSENPSPLSSSFASGMMSLNQSFNSGNLPYDKISLMLSQRTQRALSGCTDLDVGLPPASPSDTEIAAVDENSTLFLLGGYARYLCPYVWIRSNHTRLIKLTEENNEDRDNPLKLKATAKWKDEDVKVYDIIAELVKLCTYPPPINPFSVDFDYFDTLPQVERVLASGAMMNFLNTVVITKHEPRVYTAKVLEDLQRITKLHFESLQTITRDKQLPVFNQQEVQKQQQQLYKEDQEKGYRSQIAYTQLSCKADNNYITNNNINTQRGDFAYRYKSSLC